MNEPILLFVLQDTSKKIKTQFSEARLLLHLEKKSLGIVVL